MILLNKTHSERKHYSMLKNLFKKIQKKSKTGFRLIRNIALAQVKEKTRLFKKNQKQCKQGNVSNKL